jgi:hypothetical protein
MLERLATECSSLGKSFLHQSAKGDDAALEREAALKKGFDSEKETDSTDQ